MEWLSGETIASLLTLTGLEIVLGIDNIIFISILAGRVEEKDRDAARKWGLGGALLTRLALLSLISYLAALTQPLFTVASFEFSGKSLILLIGGLFLLYKSTKEIHHKLEGEEDHFEASGKARPTLKSTVIQIMFLDIVFSIDSVVTAVGMTQHLGIMVVANILALGIMLFASKAIADFVEKHPSIKVLALSFLMMIGLLLVAESFGAHVPKGYIYFAMGFSVFVELINIRVSKAKKK